MSEGANWPFETIGVAFAVVGVAFIVQGYRRQTQVEEALERGDYAPLDRGVTLLLAALGTLLGLATIVLVIANPQ